MDFFFNYLFKKTLRSFLALLIYYAILISLLILEEFLMYMVKHFVVFQIQKILGNLQILISN
jgi:hypothetical protein